MAGTCLKNVAWEKTQGCSSMESRRKTVETELSEMGLSWGEAPAVAKDKTRWKRDIVAFQCPTGRNKDWWSFKGIENLRRKPNRVLWTRVEFTFIFTAITSWEKRNQVLTFKLCCCPGQLAPFSVTGSKSALLPLKTRNVARGITVILSPNVSHQTSVTRYPTDNRS